MSMVFSSSIHSSVVLRSGKSTLQLDAIFLWLGTRREKGTNKTLIKRPYAFLCTLLYRLLCVVLTLFFSLLDNISFSWCAFVLLCGKCGYLRCNFAIAFQNLHFHKRIQKRAHNCNGIRSWRVCVCLARVNSLLYNEIRKYIQCIITEYSCCHQPKW